MPWGPNEKCEPVRSAKSLGLGLACSLLTLGLLAHPSQAHTAPGIGVTVTTTNPTAGEAVVFSGKVAGRLKHNHVALQRLRSGTWITVGGDALSSGTYSIQATPSPGTTSFRVKGVLAATGHVLQSRSIAINPKPAGPTMAQVQTRVLKDTNEFRISQGLEPLVLNEDINSVAQNWTVDMAGHNSLTHNPYYTQQMPPGWTAVAENIANGYGYTTVEDAWEASPGHRANMLGDYNEIGIGYGVASDGTPYYTQNFGKY